VPIAIEPLHSMHCVDRACVNTVAQALDLCDELDPSASGAIGVAAWLVPTTDLLFDRGMMGDGVIASGSFE
jgi:hypothetical protein